jgi:branched-chain amino acid transport system ATP-binding protein
MGMADKANQETSGLTQIELRKLELARAIAAKPKLLLSDEAMAGLTGNEVDEVLKILIKFNEEGMAIIMIEHIMRAVMQFSQRVICLDAGEVIAEGTPEEIVKDEGVERAYLGV